MSTRIINAEARISASDKTGNVFEKLASKFKGVEKAAKSLEGVSAPKFVGNFEAALKRLNTTERELQAIQKSRDALMSSLRGVKFDHMDRAVREWKSQTIAHLREVRAQSEATVKTQQRLYTGVGRFGMIAGGVGAAAYTAGRVGRAAIEANAVSQREGARDYLSGLSKADSDRLAGSALSVSGRYHSVDASTMHESLRDLAMSSRSMDLAVEMADTIGKGFVVLQSLKGKDKAIEESRKFFAALDVLGKNVDAKDVKELYSGYIKALAVEGADMNMGGVLTMSRRLKSAGATVSNRFLMTTGSGLARDMGDDRAGNAISMMMQQEVQAKDEAKQYGIRYGLRGKNEKFVDRSTMMRDPDYWAWKNVTAAMKRAHLDPDKPEDVNTFLQSAYSNSSARDVLSKLMTQRQQYEGKAVQYEKSPGPDAASQLPGRDPFVAWEGVQAQLRNLATQAPAMDAAAAGLNNLSSAISNINGAISKGEWSKIFPSVTDLLPKNEVRDAQAVVDVIKKIADLDRQISDPVKDALKSVFDGTGATRLGTRRYEPPKRLEQWPASDVGPVPWSPVSSSSASYVPATGTWSEYFNRGSSRLGTARRYGPPIFPGPEVSDTMTYGAGVGGDRSIAVTGEANVHGQAEVTFTAGSELVTIVGEAKKVIAMAGQMNINGPGSRGVSSPDAAPGARGFGGVGSQPY